MKLNTYSIKGVKKAPVNMPKDWQEKENLALLAQAIRVYEAGRHPGLSKTKTRGEIRVSTRKIYRQKGTGMARHGDRGAPIFVGGGKAHGPDGLKRQLRLAKKMKQKALKIALGLKAKEGKLFFVDGIDSFNKTKQTVGLIEKISAKEKGIKKDARFTFALSEKNKKAKLFIRNIKNTQAILFRNINAYTVYFAGVLVVDKQALKEGVKGGKGTKSIKSKENKKTEKQKIKRKMRESAKSVKNP